MNNSTATFTIIDVFKHLKFEAVKPYTWSAGLQLVKHYQAETGGLPPKELRTKTSGVGVHCFAIYPIEFWDKAEKIVKGLKAEKARQMEMF